MRAYRHPDMVDLFGRIKKMSFRQFSNYMERYGYEAYCVGLREGEEEGDALWTEDELFELFTSEGISPDTANRLIDRMLDRVGVYDGSTKIIDGGT